MTTWKFNRCVYVHFMATEKKRLECLMICYGDCFTATDAGSDTEYESYEDDDERVYVNQLPNQVNKEQILLPRSETDVFRDATPSLYSVK